MCSDSEQGMMSCAVCACADTAPEAQQTPEPEGQAGQVTPQSGPDSW